MTLDEAIKHEEEAAEKNEKKAKNYPRPDKNVRGSGRKYNDCIECASEHRQLAEWLKELKQLREQTRWIPISERLPKVADCYTVTRKIGSDLIVSACYFDGINTWHDDNWINHERNYLTDIIAWCELPEEYKSKSEVQK